MNTVFKQIKSKSEIKDWINHNLELVHMSHAKDKLPSEISGGIKQRVGIAPALSMEPKILLMDEPFGALDALTRTHLQDSVMEIHTQLGNTVIIITHDVNEAVLLWVSPLYRMTSTRWLLSYGNGVRLDPINALT